jgi:acetoin utilization deacetylase AcuC-like enzyme
LQAFFAALHQFRGRTLFDALKQSAKVCKTAPDLALKPFGHNGQTSSGPSTLQAFYADNFVLPLPQGHRFPMAKYRLLRDRLVNELPQVRMAQAPAATDGELALVHTPAYIDAVTHGTLPAPAQREIGFPWSPGMAERARRSAGATVAAARVAMGLEASRARALRPIWLAARTTRMPTRAAGFAFSTMPLWPPG